MAVPSGDLYKNCGSAWRHPPGSAVGLLLPCPRHLLPRVACSLLLWQEQALLPSPGREICAAPELLGKSRAAVGVSWVWRTESRHTGGHQAGGWLFIRRVWAWRGEVEVMRSLRGLRCSWELCQGPEPSPSQVDLVTVVG